MTEQEEQESTFDAQIILSVAGVVGLFVLYPLLTKLNIGNWSGPGEFGDLYGGLNTLFSGIAIALLIGTLVLQRKELRLQREEIAANRLELASQAKSLQDQATTLERQYKLLEHQITPRGRLQLPTLPDITILAPRGPSGVDDTVHAQVLFVNIAPTPIYLKPVVAQSASGRWESQVSRNKILGPIAYGQPMEIGVTLSLSRSLAADLQLFVTDYIGTRWELRREDIHVVQQLVHSNLKDK